MAKKEQNENKLIPNKAPDSKTSITLNRMAEFIKEYHQEDGKDFVEVCEKAKSNDYFGGYNVKYVREWFINKYYPDAFNEKKDKSKKAEFEDLLKELSK